MAAGNMPQLVRHYADHLAGAFRFFKKARKEKDIGAARDKRVDLAILHQNDLDLLRVHAGRLKHGREPLCHVVFDFRVPDNNLCTGRTRKKQRPEQGRNKNKSKNAKVSFQSVPAVLYSQG